MTNKHTEIEMLGAYRFDTQAVMAQRGLIVHTVGEYFVTRVCCVHTKVVYKNVQSNMVLTNTLLTKIRL